jgi:hypothetical protein
MNLSLNKSNLNFEIILTKLVVNHTIQIMDVESFRFHSINSNLNFSKFENMNSF